MDTIVTVAERNSNRGMVIENRKSNTNREQGPKPMDTIVTISEINSYRGMNGKRKQKVQYK